MRAALLTVSLVLLLASAAAADRLELGDGRVLQGRYAGGSEGIVSFRVDGGELLALPVSELRALHFETPPEPSVRVPSATVVSLRLTQPIGSRRNEGRPFKGVLEKPLVVDGRVIAEEGTPTLGRIARSKGQAVLRLTDLIIAGKRHRVSAEPVPLGGPLDAQSVLEFRLTSGVQVRESSLPE